MLNMSFKFFNGKISVIVTLPSSGDPTVSKDIRHRISPPDESQPLVVLPFTLPVAWTQSKRRQAVHWEVDCYFLPRQGVLALPLPSSSSTRKSAFWAWQLKADTALGPLALMITKEPRVIVQGPGSLCHFEQIWEIFGLYFLHTLVKIILLRYLIW